MKTIQFNTKAVPGSDNVDKTAMFSLQIFCPDCAVDSEIIKQEHAVCSLLLLQREVFMVYVPSDLNCVVLHFERI